MVKMRNLMPVLTNLKPVLRNLKAILTNLKPVLTNLKPVLRNLIARLTVAPSANYLTNLKTSKKTPTKQLFNYKNCF